MAGYQSHLAQGVQVPVAPPESSLLAAALPSALRQRLTSLRKVMQLEDLDQIRTGPKLSADCVYGSERAGTRNWTDEKKDQVKVTEYELSRPSSSSSFSPAISEPSTPGVDCLPAALKGDKDSEVAWNRVSPGFNLVQNATQEALRHQPDNALARSLYINGLLYLLEALPDDLSAEEIATIRPRLPKSVERTIPICTRACQGHTNSDNGQRARAPSLLHRVFASSIIQIFIIIHFLIPYFKLLFQHLYKYERTHRISERMLVFGVNTIDNIGKGGNHVGSVASRFGEGDIGKRLRSIAAWGLEETVRGVSEGVGEGLVVLGVADPGIRDASDEAHR
ncbi:hypothetical protein FQN54_000147 [Arachnomyces sp. PD_36]|nr:hypothetical protein FQN54_000147 [Arachnomyces sp. PD_36]